MLKTQTERESDQFYLPGFAQTPLHGPEDDHLSPPFHGWTG